MKVATVDIIIKIVPKPKQAIMIITLLLKIDNNILILKKNKVTIKLPSQIVATALFTSL